MQSWKEEWPVSYVCGVQRKGSDLRLFVTVKGDLNIPSDVVILQEGAATREEALSLAQELRKKFRKLVKPNEQLSKEFVEQLPKKLEELSVEDSKPLPLQKIGAGSFAVHNDGGKTHFAVILEIQDDWVHALFLTSNKVWGKHTREASRTECGMFGLHRSKPTYITLVKRFLKDFYYESGRLSSGQLRSYKEEFLTSHKPQ